MLKDKIKQIRLLNGMTQKEFASILGVTQATVSGWERGTSDPENFRLKKIAELGDMSLNELSNSTLSQWIESEIESIKVEDIVVGDDFLLGRLDALQEIEEKLKNIK